MVALPLPGLVPAQPSPDAPPAAVHEVAPVALHESVMVLSVVGACWLVVKVTDSTARPSLTNAPVCAESSTDCSVTVPVLLVVSAVEAKTEEKAVNCAVTVSGAGVGGGLAGQTPAEFAPFWSAARLALPTSRLFGSNSAAPEAPAPTLPV